MGTRARLIALSEDGVAAEPAGVPVETDCELERRRLDPGDVYHGRAALDLPVLVPRCQSTVDSDPLVGMSVQVYDVAAQNVEETPEVSSVTLWVPYW